MTPNLDEGRRLLAEATAGPWRALNLSIYGKDGRSWVIDALGEEADTQVADCDDSEADARLIAYAVNALPALLDAAEERDRLRAALVKARKAVDDAARIRVAGATEMGQYAALMDAMAILDAALSPRKGEEMADGPEDGYWNPKPGVVCAHGQLARQCELCEKDAELARLRAENERLAVDLERTTNRGDNLRELDAAEERDRLRETLEDKEWRISVAKVAAERAYENQKVVAPLGVPQLLFAPIWGAISDAIDTALAPRKGERDGE